MNTIQQAWESYLCEVIPADASPVQIEEIRRAFYAGAVSFCSIVVNLDDEDLSPYAALAMFNGLVDELKQFKVITIQ